VYDPLLVKETNEHHLQFAFLRTCFFGSWRPRTLPLRRLQFCLWVVSINDAFIACDDDQEECGIIFQFPSVPDRSLLNCLSDPGSTLLAQTSLQSDACSAVL